MCDDIRDFGQGEYTRVLDFHRARARHLKHGECELILMEHGATYQQAKNGAYVYLHHCGGGGATHSRTLQVEYDRILDEFGATERTYGESTRYLESLGFTYGQAKTAAHKYRQSHGLIGRRKYRTA